jgi:hypothetical protein
MVVPNPSENTVPPRLTPTNIPKSRPPKNLPIRNPCDEGAKAYLGSENEAPLTYCGRGFCSAGGGVGASQLLKTLAKLQTRH